MAQEEMPRREKKVMMEKILTFIFQEILELLLRELYFVLLMKSHLQSYPCPLQINSQISLLRPADSLFNLITDWLDGNTKGNQCPAAMSTYLSSQEMDGN